MVDARDFSDFYAEVHRRPPFPWQVRLAAQVLEAGRFPAALDLPTGTGKTSVIDIALFALAVRPDAFPRRIVLVVDRRVVVAQGHQHASTLAKRLASAAPETVAGRVAGALRRLWAGEKDEAPLAVAELRGGMPREGAWASRPDRPLVVASTVDQVGSRLLFRGYGVSKWTQPIHAGLLGNDVLYLLDEVHLSTPFAETLLAVEHWRERFATSPLRRPFGVVVMSATLGTLLDDAAGMPFSLDEADLESPVLAARLEVSKRARLRSVKATGRDEAAKRQLMADACASEASAAVHAGSRRVGVVVNRVDTARRVAALLRESIAADADVQLLTGRMRPLDRDRILEPGGSVLPRVSAACPRDPAARPLVLVATQCIEAGADFDLDALVTECASLDALRQRFGRLDRLGELRGAAHAVILQRSDAKGSDPVYGDALAATWAWLEEIAQDGTVDFGIRHLPEPSAERRKALLPPAAHAPILLPAHLDLWAQTNPSPEPDPDVAFWLHGSERRVDDVQIVWRADVTEGDLVAAEGTEGDPSSDLLAVMAACPPSSLESIGVSIAAVRAWLASTDEPEVADVPIAEPERPQRAQPASASRRVLIWRGGERSRLGLAADLRPGDTIVAPATWGGIFNDNWDPCANDPVEDLGDLAQWKHRGRATLRLGAAAPSWLSDAALAEIQTADDPDETIASLLFEVDDGDVPEHWRRPLVVLRPRSSDARALRQGARIVPLRSTAGETRIVVARRRVRLPDRQGEISTEGDLGSFIAREVDLVAHLERVSRKVRAFAERLNLSEDLVGDLDLAGLCHDAGKADPRFQQWLVGGSEVRLAGLSAPIAKSAGIASDREARTLARQRSGYPEGARHELLSATLAERLIANRATNADLVRHLVASHHGWCRPFAPPAPDSSPRQVSISLAGMELSASSDHGLARLDSGVVDRFWWLIECVGWWGLAYLEALLRLADHRVSAEHETSGELT